MHIDQFICAKCGASFKVRPIRCACGATFPSNDSRDVLVRVGSSHKEGRIDFAVAFSGDEIDENGADDDG